MKFISSSPTQAPDLQNKITISKLDIINSNLLYLTHELDQVKKIVTTIYNSSKLQKQVDEYFEDETSPQTESVEQ